MLKRAFSLSRQRLSSRKIHCTFRLCKEAETEEDMDKLQSNPYYSKYADKISKLQSSSPQQFLERLSVLEEKSATKSNKKEPDFSMPTKPKSGSGATMQQKEKKLDEVMKLELIEDKTSDEIAEIWKAHFATQNALSAVIPRETYAQMKERFEKFNTFLFPVPRQNGYEFFVVQFSGHEAHFTTLINFQAFGENAPECLTMVHYPDLASQKGIVLMSGLYDDKLLNTQEAQCLANQVEMYYCNPAPPKLALLEAFTSNPQEFKYQDLVSQIENIGLLTGQ